MPAPQIGALASAANGTPTAAPQIGAMAPVQAIAPASGLGQFGSALGDLPDNIQQQQLARSEVKDQQSQLDDHRLQQFTQMAMSNPQYAQHPEVMKGVSDIYKRRGLPPPITTDENGSRLDMNTLMPGKPFSALTEAEKAPYRALEPAQRQAEMIAGRIMGAPDEFLKADASVPLSPGEGVQLLKTLADGVTVLADPTKDPLLYAPLLKSAQGPLGKLGIHVMDMLTPQITSALQTRSQNSVSREVALGITAPAEAVKRSEALTAYEQGRLANAVNETKIKGQQADTAAKREADLAIKNAAQMKRWDVQNQGTLGNLNVAQGRLVQLKQFQSTSGAAGVLKYGRFLQSQLSQAQAGYDSLRAIAQKYETSIPAVPVPDDVIQRMTTLQDQISTLTPQVGGAIADANATLANNVRASTGSTGASIVPKGFTGDAPAGYKLTGRPWPGKPGFYEVVDDKGKTRGWQP